MTKERSILDLKTKLKLTFLVPVKCHKIKELDTPVIRIKTKVQFVHNIVALKL